MSIWFVRVILNRAQNILHVVKGDIWRPKKREVKHLPSSSWPRSSVVKLHVLYGDKGFMVKICTPSLSFSAGK